MEVRMEKENLGPKKVVFWATKEQLKNDLREEDKG